MDSDQKPRPNLAHAPTAEHAAIRGIGSYRPRRRVSNAEICTEIDSDPDWILSRSGIRERRWASDDESISMMAVAAARQAIASAGLTPDQVDCVIVATVTHLHQTPAIATTVAFDLAATNAAAFDISAACAGFCYGVALADSLVRAGTARNVVTIGVERLTDITDRTDRSTAFLFADGAGAAVISASEAAGIGPVVWGSDGQQAELITVKPWQHAVLDQVPPALVLDGPAVFRWAAYDMAKTAQQALDAANVTADDIQVFAPHQANDRITNAMAKSLGLPDSVVIARDIVDQGNTSAASIPMALDALVSTGQATSGQLALIIGFGAGLVYAGQVINIP